MIEFWIIIAIFCLLVVTGGTTLFLRRLSHSVDESRQEREAWQQAQEGRQRTWEVRQGKHILDAEKKLADQLKDARREWRDWHTQIQQDHQEWRADVDFEKELTRLPRVEELELAHQKVNGRIKPGDWHPAVFYKADLRGRDLSYRYMERADLREAQLRKANLCMADLAGASMAGADLQQAELVGTNLAGADLRGANLSGVNLMVADLHNAVLHGANLSGAHNLTPEQLQTAIYDSTTTIDSEIDITLPRMPSVATTPSQLLATTSSANKVQSDAEVMAPVEHAMTPNTSEQRVENEPATPLNAESISSAPDDANVVQIAETDPIIPPLTPVLENEAQTPEAVQNVDTPALSTETSATLPETPAPITPATATKSSTTRKRSNRTKQATSTPTQTLASKTKMLSASETDGYQEADTSAETEIFTEEKALPNKIIQWPTRAPKTSPLPNTSEQNKGEKAQANRGSSLATHFNETSDDGEDQHAQAN